MPEEESCAGRGCRIVTFNDAPDVGSHRQRHNRHLSTDFHKMGMLAAGVYQEQ